MKCDNKFKVRDKLSINQTEEAVNYFLPMIPFCYFVYPVIIVSQFFRSNY